MNRILSISVVMKRAATAALAACLSGCAVSYNNPDFGGYRPVVLADGLKSEAGIEKSQSDLALKFPGSDVFTMNLRITDEALTYSSISITEVTARYRDGTEARLARPWKANFAELRDSRPKDRPVNVEVESLFFSHQDVKVTVGGYFTTPDGRKFPFRITENFKAGADKGTMLITHW